MNTTKDPITYTWNYADSTSNKSNGHFTAINWVNNTCEGSNTLGRSKGLKWIHFDLSKLDSCVNLKVESPTMRIIFPACCPPSIFGSFHVKPPMRTVWESKVDISIPATKGSILILLIFQLVLGPSHREIDVAFLHGGMLDQRLPLIVLKG